MKSDFIYEGPSQDPVEEGSRLTGLATSIIVLQDIFMPNKSSPDVSLSSRPLPQPARRAASPSMRSLAAMLLLACIPRV